MEFFWALYSSSRLFSTMFMLLDMAQQMENGNWWGVLLKRQDYKQSIPKKYPDIYRIQHYSTVNL